MDFSTGLTAKQIAEFLKAEIRGSQNVRLTSFKPADTATESDLSFLTKNIKTNAGSVLVGPSLEINHPSQIIVPHPLLAAITLIEEFIPVEKPNTGIHSTAVIDPSATIGENVTIGAYSVIGRNAIIGDSVVVHPHVVVYAGAQIGQGTTLHSGSVIREHVIIGKKCTIQNGAILGGDGFGYIPDKVHGHRVIPHIGNLILEDEVDIGANATIDRAMLGSTKIGTQSKIDNLVQVGHNVVIGKRSILCGTAAVSGSCIIGDNVTLGGGVGVADHIKIGNNVRAAARTGITGDIEPNKDIAGFPAMEIKDWRRQVVQLRKLTRKAGKKGAE